MTPRLPGVRMLILRQLFQLSLRDYLTIFVDCIFTPIQESLG